MKKVPLIIAAACLGLVGAAGAFAATHLAPTQTLAVGEDRTNVDIGIVSLQIITGYNPAQKILIIELSESDFNLIGVDNANPYDYNIDQAAPHYSFWKSILINGSPFDSDPHPKYMYYMGYMNSISIEFTDNAKSLTDGDTITFAKGIAFPSYSALSGRNNNQYTVKKETTFEFKNSGFVKKVNSTPVNTGIGGVNIVDGYWGGLKFLNFAVTGSDYNNQHIVENGGNDYKVTATAPNLGNFTSMITFNGSPIDFKNHDMFLNYKATGGFAVEMTTLVNGLHAGDQFVIPQGTTFPSYALIKTEEGALYTIDRDLTFIYDGQAFAREFEFDVQDTSVTGVELTEGYQPERTFLTIYLSNSDYDREHILENGGNDYRVYEAPVDYRTVSNFYNSIKLNGTALNLNNNYPFLVYRAKLHSISLEVTNILDSFHENDVLTIDVGTTFPSYSLLKDQSPVVYSNTEQVNFVFKNGDFEQQYDILEVDNDIVGVIQTEGYQGQNFLLFQLNDTDWTHEAIEENAGNDYNINNAAFPFRKVTNFTNNISYNGQVIDCLEKASYLVYKANEHCMGIDFTSVTTGASEGDTVFVPAGTTFPSYALLKGKGNAVYKTQRDATYIYSHGAFRRDVETIKEATSVSSLRIINGYAEGSRYLLIDLAQNDYDQIEENKGNDYKVSGRAVAVSDCSNYGYSITRNGVAYQLEAKNTFLNYYGNIGSIGLEFGAEETALENGDQITVPANTTFPSYNILKGENNVVYETSAEKTFTYYEGAFHVCEEHLGTELHYDETGHWLECEICSSVHEFHEHHIVSTSKEPTCTEPGFETCDSCDVCGYVISGGNEIQPLGHDFETGEWIKDEEGHYKACAHHCGEFSEKEPHTYGADNKTCTVCGYVRNVVFLTVTNGYIMSGESTCVPGSLVTISANAPEEGKKFEGWYVDDKKVSSDATYSFVIEADMTIEARYVDAPAPTPEPSKGGCGGSIIGGSVFAALGLAGVAAVLVKKKKSK